MPDTSQIPGKNDRHFLEKVAKANIGRPSKLIEQFDQFQKEVIEYLASPEAARYHQSPVDNRVLSVLQMLKEKIDNAAKEYATYAIEKEDIECINEAIESFSESPVAETDEGKGDYTDEVLTEMLAKSEKIQPAMDIEMIKQAMEYWKQRCDAAEECLLPFIDKINLNHDLYQIWQSLKQKEK